jgi:hypothetical protein
MHYCGTKETPWAVNLCACCKSPASDVLMPSGNKTGNVHINVRMRHVRSRIRCCRGKAILITYSGCVSVALVTQYAMHMRRIILSSVACLALPYFSTLFDK